MVLVPEVHPLGHGGSSVRVVGVHHGHPAARSAATAAILHGHWLDEDFVALDFVLLADQGHGRLGAVEHDKGVVLVLLRNVDFRDIAELVEVS